MLTRLLDTTSQDSEEYSVVFAREVEWRPNTKASGGAWANGTETQLSNFQSSHKGESGTSFSKAGLADNN